MRRANHDWEAYGKPDDTKSIAYIGCCGHIRTTCRGYQAFDQEDRLLGVFASPGEAAAAILESEGDQ